MCPLTIELAIADAATDTALPGATATEGRSTSVQNLARTPPDTDDVFRDGYDSQLATITGTVSGGLTAALTVGVDA